ncbi:MAG: redox-sensing transcriptional repressor Rex [Anaerolineales bacterium]
MGEKTIPDIVIGRLPLYLRTVQRLQLEGQAVTSSQDLADRLGISAAQIRKDLSQFGEFGKQGTGYSVDYLVEQLSSILNVDKVWDVVVVGAGDIGSAVARYGGFANRGFQVTMIFDNDPKKIGTHIGSFVVQDSADLVPVLKNARVKVAMIAVPAANAQVVVNELVKAGVKAILNYAPLNISVPPDVHVQHTDPVTHLQRMTYYLD